MGDSAARRRRLIETTLGPTGSTVEVHFSINEIPHVVRRTAPNGDVTLKVGDAEFVKVREAEVRDLLPIQAYSQKQLSSVSVRMEELTRFVTSPIRRDLANIDQQIEEVAGGRIRENYATLQRTRQLERSVHRLSLSDASLAEQAVNLRSALDDLSDDDRNTLRDKPRFDTASTAIQDWQSSAQQALVLADSASAALIDLAANLMQPSDVPESLRSRLERLRDHTNALLNEIAAQVNNAAGVVREALDNGSERMRDVDEVIKAVESFAESYDDVKARSTAHAVKLAELGEIEKQHREVGATLRSQREEMRGLGGDPSAEHARLMHLLFETMDARSNRIASQCVSLSEDSGGLLRATLQKGLGWMRYRTN